MPIFKLKVTCISDTAKALLCSVPGEKEFWVPKSQVHDDSEVYGPGHEGKLVMKDWWAEKFDTEKAGWESE